MDIEHFQHPQRLMHAPSPSQLSSAQRNHSSNFYRSQLFFTILLLFKYVLLNNVV